MSIRAWRPVSLPNDVGRAMVQCILPNLRSPARRVHHAGGGDPGVARRVPAFPRQLRARRGALLCALAGVAAARAPVGGAAPGQPRRDAREPAGPARGQDRVHAGQDRPPQGHRARPDDARSPRYTAADQPPAGAHRLAAAAPGRRSQADLDAKRAELDPHPGRPALRARAASSACARRLQVTRRALADAARRALQGRAARPRHGDPQLQGLRRPARARRVHRSASPTRTARSSRVVRARAADAVAHRGAPRPPRAAPGAR